MEPRWPQSPREWALAALGVLAVLFVLAALFDLGPFRNEELSVGGSTATGEETTAIAQGDEICRRAHEAFVDLQTRPPATAGEAAELTGRLIDIASDEADELGSLGGTPQFEAQLSRYIAARQDGIDAMRDGLAAARDRDPEAYEKAQAEVAASQRERHRIARRMGFTVCSRPLELG